MEQRGPDGRQQAFGYGKDLGSIEPGKLADLIFVQGDPLTHIEDVANVQQVMVGGRILTLADLMAPFASKP